MLSVTKIFKCHIILPFFYIFNPYKMPFNSKRRCYACDFTQNPLLWTRFYRDYYDTLIQKSAPDSKTNPAPFETPAPLKQDEKPKPVAWEIDFKGLSEEPDYEALELEALNEALQEKLMLKLIRDSKIRISWFSPQGLMNIFRRNHASSARTFRTYTKIERGLVSAQERAMRQEWVLEWVENGKDPQISLAKVLDEFEAKLNATARRQPIKRAANVLEQS